MPLRELGKVDRLFDLTLLLIMEEGKHEFVEPLCALLATLSRPFSKKSAADEFRASNLVSTLFSRIGTCFADGVPQPVQIAAAKAIAAHASAYGNRPSILSLSNITEADVDNDESLRVFLNNQRLIARSSAPQGIVRGLQSAVSSADGPLIETVVDTVAQLSYFPENCAILLEEGVLSVLAGELAAHDLAYCALLTHFTSYRHVRS